MTPFFLDVQKLSPGLTERQLISEAKLNSSAAMSTQEAGESGQKNQIALRDAFLGSFDMYLENGFHDQIVLPT